MPVPISLVADFRFRSQATTFAKWFGRERRAVLEMGKIAAGWLERYSRTRNATKMADALNEITGLKITGRSLRYYRDIYLLYTSWSSTRRGRRKCGNDFHTSHVGPGHLRVVSGAQLSDTAKHRLLDEVERDQHSVKQTTALVRQREIEENRSRRRAHLRRNDPRVRQGDCIDVIRHLEPESIHHLFCDWQWTNDGVWRNLDKAQRVHRPHNPPEHLCQLLRTARPYMNQQCIVWIFSKSTAFENGEIGLPWSIQRAAHDTGLIYCSEYIAPHTVAGYRSAHTFLALKHEPIHPFVPEGFDFSPVKFAPSISIPRTSPNHISQITIGEENHPYQKPVELFEDLIEMGTPAGLVFDAFAGSGAAGVAAVRSGCPYIGAELVRHYVRAANRSIALTLAERRDNSQSA